VSAPTALDPSHVEREWEHSVLPALHDYIAIPNVSPAFDPHWRDHGHMDRAVALVRDWCAARSVIGLKISVHELPERTPVILMTIPAHGLGTDDDTVLLYGHLDKQPEMTGWRDDLGPWKPVLESDRLYGRGGADDGYSAFASVLAIEAAQAAGMSHHRCVVLIEACEESGSIDLPAHLETLRDVIGSPSLVVCLDSGCLDYERLWVTTSLRGMAAGNLRVDVLTEGVHSGEASGVVPSSFRVVRQLLDRIEDASSGRVLLPELHVDIPADRRAQAAATAVDFPIHDHFPWVPGMRPAVVDHTDQLLARTWIPTLSVVGVDGIPASANSGNVLRPFTSLKLSFRLPPTCDPDRALAAIEQALTTHPPYGATVRFTDTHAAPGWNAPTFSPWLEQALDETSRTHFGNGFLTFGEGGTIPFMGMLGEMFPEAQFVITGVLGPGTNAHGPNEYLHVPTAKRVTACIADLLHAHATRQR
jgi:acetylornithine deacetylase/succinyl-diaminopimelate desuccinylase-like protein